MTDNEKMFVLESSKFLKQLQEQALNDIKGSISVDDNSFLLKGLWYQKALVHNASPDSTVYLKFSLNEVIHEIEYTVKDEYLKSPIDIGKEVVSKLYHQIAEIIATEISKHIKIEPNYKLGNK